VTIPHCIDQGELNGISQIGGFVGSSCSLLFLRGRGIFALVFGGIGGLYCCADLGLMLDGEEKGWEEVRCSCP
jgi:hypothetical protein